MTLTQLLSSETSPIDDLLLTPTQIGHISISFWLLPKSATSVSPFDCYPNRPHQYLLLTATQISHISISFWLLPKSATSVSPFDYYPNQPHQYLLLTTTQISHINDLLLATTQISHINDLLLATTQISHINISFQLLPKSATSMISFGYYPNQPHRWSLSLSDRPLTWPVEQIDRCPAWTGGCGQPGSSGDRHPSPKAAQSVLALHGTVGSWQPGSHQIIRCPGCCEADQGSLPLPANTSTPSKNNNFKSTNLGAFSSTSLNFTM